MKRFLFLFGILLFIQHGIMHSQTLQVTLSPDRSKVDRYSEEGEATIIFVSNIEDLSIVCTEENSNEPITKINENQWVVHVDAKKDIEFDNVCYRNFLLKSASSAEYYLSTEPLYPKTVLYYTITLPNELEPEYLENQSRFVAKEAREMVNRGETDKALAALYDVIPHNLTNPERPYVSEVEQTMREIFNKDLKLQKILMGHQKGVSSIFITPKNDIFSFGADSSLISWDISTGKELFRRTNICNPIVSKNKTYTLSSSNGNYSVWNNTNGSLVFSFNDEPSPRGITSYRKSFTEDEKSVIIEHKNFIHVWDIHNKVLKTNFPKQRGYTYRVSNDGTMAVSFSHDENDLKIWDLEKNTLIHTLKGHSSTASGAFFSSGNNYLISYSTDSTAIKWDLRTGSALRQFKGHTSRLDHAEINSQENRLILYDINHNSILWDYNTGRKITTFQNTRIPIFASDGTIVMTALWENNEMELWDSFDGHKKHTIGQVFRHAPRGINTNKTFYIAATNDATIKMWNIVTGTQIATLNQSYDIINKIAISDDGHLVATASSNGNVYLWSLNAHDKEYNYTIHHSRIDNIYFLENNNTVLTTGKDSLVIITDLNPYQRKNIHRGREDFSCDIQYSSKTNIFTIQDGDVLYIYDSRKRKALDSLRVNKINCHSLAEDGRHIAIGNIDGMIGLYDIQKKKMKVISNAYHSYVSHIVISPDGSRMAINYGHMNDLSLWNAETGTLIDSLKGHKGDVRNISFSPNGNYLASSSEDGTAIIWNALNGQLIHQLHGPQSEVYKTVFSPDSNMALTISYENKICLWDIIKGELVGFLDGNIYKLHNALFSSDGKYIVTVGAYGIRHNMQIWDATYRKCVHSETLSNPSNVLSLSPDGRMIAIGTADGHIITNEMPSNLQDILDECKSILNGYTLSPEDKKKLYLDAE